MFTVTLTITNVMDQDHLDAIVDLVNDEAYVSDVSDVEVAR